MKSCFCMSPFILQSFTFCFVHYPYFCPFIGQETTSNQLSFTLFEILKHPNVENRYLYALVLVRLVDRLDQNDLNVLLNISYYIIKLFDVHIDISWLVFLISCKKIVAVFCLLLS